MKDKSSKVLALVVGMLLEREKDLQMMPKDAIVAMNQLNSFIIHHSNMLPSKNIREFIVQLKTTSLQEMGFTLDDRQMESLKIITEEGFVNQELKSWHSSNQLKP